MQYRFYGDTLQLIKYILRIKEEVIAGRENILATTFTAATEDEKIELLQKYPDAIVEEVDNIGFEWLDGLTFTQEQLQNDEVEKAIEMGKMAYFNMLNAPTVEDYLLELDYRLAKFELGF